MYKRSSTICQKALLWSALVWLISGLTFSSIQANEWVSELLSGASIDNIWDIGERLSERGNAATEDLLKALPNADAVGKVTLGYALLRLGEQREAVDLLTLIARDATQVEQLQRAALSALGSFGGEEAALQLRDYMRDESQPDILRVEAAQSLMRLSRSALAGQMLRQYAAMRENSRVASEAALALARLGRYDDVSDYLRLLEKQPGGIGDEARNLRLLNERTRTATNRPDFMVKLIQEVTRKIDAYYAYDENDSKEKNKLDHKKQAGVAASAILSSIDPFNSYLDEEDWNRFSDEMSSSYSGIGAYVGMQNDRFTIITPMYNRPAYNAGLRAQDVVDKVDGVDIKGKDVNEIVRLLKGPKGSSVKLTILRAGWLTPHDITVTRDDISVESVLSSILPGNIGYIRLTQFQQKAEEKLRSVLRDFSAKKINGLLFDLSDNPGGSLEEAVLISNLFLPGRSLIVSTRGRENVYPRKSYYSRGNDNERYDGPLVTMINRGSASASEIVAGALKDHQRATLVGSKTYGKGSVQQLFPIEATNNKTYIKLTIAKYYLPNGDCIHKLGIKPDIETTSRDIKVEEIKARLDLRETRLLDKWCEENFAANEELLRSLLLFDNYQTDKYPDFDKLLEKARQETGNNDLSADDVRKELRVSLRLYLANQRGEYATVDFQEDYVLQDALIALEKKLEQPLPDIPLYNWIREQVAERQRLADLKLQAKGNDLTDISSEDNNFVPKLEE